MLRQILLLLLFIFPAVSVLSAADDSTPQLLSTTGGKGAANTWESIEEMQKAAESGNPVACYELGEMHLAGRQVTRDVPKAVALLERAAAAGHANAAFRLGKLNADGEQIPKNLAAALVHYRAAANGGIAEAQFNLGAMYASGRGVKRDYSEGLAWLILASKNGADSAGEQQLREFLTKGKRTSVIAAAERRALELETALKEGTAAATGGNASRPAGTSPGREKPAKPAASQSDPKVKLGAPDAPGRIQISPPTGSGLGVPVIAPPAPPPVPAEAPGDETPPAK